MENQRHHHYCHHHWKKDFGHGDRQEVAQAINIENKTCGEERHQPPREMKNLLFLLILSLSMQAQTFEECQEAAEHNYRLIGQYDLIGKPPN